MAKHPQTDELRSYLLGKLPEAAAQQIDSHIDDCPACEQTMASLDGEADTLITQLNAQASAVSGDGTDPQLRRALDFVIQHGKTVSPGTVAAKDASQPPAEQLREYKLLEKLGEGGMGAVYKAVHTRLNKIVAIKLLAADKMQSTDAVARFQREMLAVGNLDHPHLIRAHDAGEVDGPHFLVMEFVAGSDVNQIVKQHGPLPIAAACEIVRQAALGLAEAHRHGLVHRDVKPSNLMLTSKGQVKVLDLGLALLADQLQPQDLTTSGQMMGTIDYMAPEQGGDSHRVDARADIYSLGATLYKLLTGDAPFSGPQHDTLMRKFVALSSEKPAPVRTKRPEVPAVLAAIVERMLAKDPAARPATADEVAAALSPFIAGVDLNGLVALSGAAASSARGSGEVGDTVSLPANSLAPAATAELKIAQHRPPTRNWVIAAGFAAAALLALGVVLIIRNRDGKETGRLELKPGDTVELQQSPDKVPAIANPPTPAKPAIDKPVALVRGDQPVRFFRTLAGALNEQQPGDWLELHTNGRVELTGVDSVKGQFRIRAAAGYRPMLVFTKVIQLTDAAVLVDSCDFDMRVVNSGLQGNGPAWEFRGCRIWGYGSSIMTRSTNTRFVNCLLASAATLISASGDSDVTLDNCITAVYGGVLSMGYGKQHLTLRNNTFSLFGFGTPTVVMYTRANNATIHVEAEGNLFLISNSGLIGPMMIDNTIPPAEKNLEEKVVWRGKENLYVGNWQLAPNKLVGADLADWNALWTQPEEGSRGAAEVDVDWMQLHKGSLAAVMGYFEPLIGASRQRHSLPDLGPDVANMGPGGAYQRARELARGKPFTPDEIREEVSDGKPLVVFRKDEHAGSYKELSDALAAMQDGDVLEFRTDALISDVVRPAKPRTLTLRAGIGYQPRIQINSEIQDRLILEGLTFPRAIQFGVGNNTTNAFDGTGRLERMSHCLVEGAVQGGMGGGDSQPATITHSFVHRVHAQLKEGGLRISQSQVREVQVAPWEEKGNHLQIDHCLLAGFSPGWNGYAFLLVRSDNPQPPLRVTMEDCYVQSHAHLLFANENLVWQGDRNVYGSLQGYASGQAVQLLSDMQKKYGSDQKSAEDLPLLLEPEQWAISARSLEMAKRRSGGFVGADVSQVAGKRK
ncbi:serine/threonine protein kinase [Anatilimnocola floriformis]|uniref:serine/threonine protein kinase n=1 Tax=Anatilimnocola floriformis TaxID=2948575 RepID=UPI0020C20625|nr:serine/threonine-protein kinase [Anatilimnocola floriformis]